MIGIDVRHNIDKVEASLRSLEDQVKDKATVRALNRALDQTATGASREIRKVYNVRHAAVLKAMSKFRASRGNLTATLRIQGRRIALIEFDARWRRGQPGGATVKVKLQGGRKTVRGAFIAQGRGGNVHVFRRAGPGRLPIQALRSVSLPQTFVNRAVQEAVRRIAADSFLKNFAQQIRFLGGR